jgi:uncharacterized membrane protein
VHDRALLGIVLALAGLQWLWYGYWAPPQVFSLGTVLTLTIAPLLIAAVIQALKPGLGAVYSGLLLLLYFCKGVMEAWSTPLARVPALLEIALTVGFYAVLYQRVARSKAARAAAATR